MAPSVSPGTGAICLGPVHFSVNSLARLSPRGLLFSRSGAGLIAQRGEMNLGKHWLIKATCFDFFVFVDQTS